MQLRAAAEGSHRVAEPRLDERVDDDRRAALHAIDGELEVGDRLDARMPDLQELLVGELRLERLHEARGRLAGRVGNNVQLARSLGFEKSQPFLEMKGQPIGRKVQTSLQRDDLIARLQKSLGGPVRCLGVGPAETRTIGIVTGGAGGEIHAAACEGLDTFITGEAPHWAAVAAEELGINLIIGGHYATETFGVKAFAAHLSEKFQIPWEFIDHPTGL